MRNLIAAIIAVLSILFSVGVSSANMAIQPSEHVSFIPGPVNGVSIEKDNARLVVYGDPTGKIEKTEMVLFTHSRRDVVSAMLAISPTSRNSGMSSQPAGSMTMPSREPKS